MAGIGCPVIRTVGNIAGIDIQVQYGYFKNFKVYPDGTGSTQNNGVVVSNAARTNIENIYAYSCGGHGFLVDSSGNSNANNNNIAMFNNCQSRLNDGDGFHVAGGVNNNAILFNNVDASSNTGNGISLGAAVVAEVFNNAVLQNNTGYGMYFTGSGNRTNSGTAYFESNASGSILFDTLAHTNMIWATNDGNIAETVLAGTIDLNGYNSVLYAAGGATQRYAFNTMDFRNLGVSNNSDVGRIDILHTGTRAYSIKHGGSASAGTVTFDKGTSAAMNVVVNGTFTADGLATVENILITDPVFDDLVIDAATITGTGGAVLNTTAWLTTLRVIDFVNGGTDYGYFAIQLPHSYVPGTDILFHVHFTNPANITSAQTVVFDINYTASAINGGFGATAAATATFTNDAAARAAINAVAPAQLSTTTILPNTHLIAGGCTISGAGLSLSSILYFRIERNAVDTYAGSAYLLSADAHIQKNRLGSENEYTG
jgi:hypothetical protein